MRCSCLQKKAAEKKEQESAKVKIVQVDDLLTFRQFSKKPADDMIDVGSAHLVNANLCLI